MHISERSLVKGGNGMRKRWMLSIAAYLSIFGFLLSKSSFSGVLASDYVVLLLGYLFVGALMVSAIALHNADLFEPILLIFGLLIGIFSVAPILLTAKGITTLYGTDFMVGCQRATFVYVLACTFFYVGYYTVKMDTWRKSSVEGFNDVSDDRRFQILRRMEAVWLVCLLIALFYEVKIEGRGFAYILSIGQIGSISDSSTSETPLAFLINFAYSMVIPWVYILYWSRNNILKVGTTIMMIALYTVCGFRFILVIMALTALTVYYIKNKKRPSGIAVTVMTLIAIVVFTLIGGAREGLRHGTGADWTLNTEGVETTFESNFNIYQPFYGVAANYPENYSYTYGEGMIFDTAITFLPRAIWRTKPLQRDFASMVAIRNSVGDAVIDKATMAIPDIGEIYIDFGLLGIALIMFLYGRLLRKSLWFYRGVRANFASLVLYAVIYSLNFQFVIRGYMPNNFYLFLFVVWPVVLGPKITGNNMENEEANEQI